MTDLELPPLPLSVGSVDISSPERGIACAKPGLPYFNREMMESYARLAIQSHLEALAKRGLVLCRAEPVCWIEPRMIAGMGPDGAQMADLRDEPTTRNTMPLYAAATEDSSADR